MDGSTLGVVPQRGAAKGLHYALQPLLMASALFVWWFNKEEPIIYPAIIVAVQIVLGLCEHFFPARTEWRQTAKEKAANIGMVFLLYVLLVFVGTLYAQHLTGPLEALRASLSLDIWPHTWPILVQLLMVFFLGEFVWYWMHRAEHRWSLVWRLSGHGSHHSFKRLEAINFGLNHPLEAFFLVFPSLFIELLFGVGIAAAGAGVLTTVLASIAHANISLNSRVIGWFFTTNEYHIRHHSIVLDESNTNYGCAAILWDRVFRTWSPGYTKETGVGPTEPSLAEKLMMPWREPLDSAVAPGLNSG